MDNYKHKSGSKEKELKLKACKIGRRTLFEVGVKKSEAVALSDHIAIAGQEDIIAGVLNVEPQISTDLPCLSSLPIEEAENLNPSEAMSKSYENIIPLSNALSELLQSANEENDCKDEDSLNLSDIQPELLSDVNDRIESKIPFDLSTLAGCPDSDVIESFVRRGPNIIPANLPHDGKRAFPRLVLFSKTKNGEHRPRDWLVWNDGNQSLYCFPCRLFGRSTNLPENNRSVLMSDDGWRKELSWRKLYDKLPKHEVSSFHKKCYIEWRELERRLKEGTDIQSQLDNKMTTKTKYYRDLFRRLLSVTLFLAERGLPFRGDSVKIGDPSNGNFLGLIELLATYDPLLREHVTNVKKAQEDGKRLQANYLSSQSQNEFIQACEDKVLSAILSERGRAKYYSILVDATPDLSHQEQITFVLRYLSESEACFQVSERFLSFVSCNKKSGQDIANEIIKELEKHGIPLTDCRGQGFDNGANMVGIYKGVRAIISKMNPLALFSNCAAHSLNLCGINTAECCEDAVTFFGTLQQLYKFFAKGPQRWEILETEINCSLHKLCDTRWSARIDAVKPFAKHLPGIKRAISRCKELNINAESKTELLGFEKYLKSFKCLLMATIWFKILVTLDHRNKVLQARDTTLDIEVKNIDSLIEEMKVMRNKFDSILREVKLVSHDMLIDLPTDTKLMEKRQRKRKLFHDDIPDDEPEPDLQHTHVIGMETKEERDFRINVFFRIIDSVISGLTERFIIARNLSQLFQCLWQYLDVEDSVIAESCSSLLATFQNDLSQDLTDELIHLKSIHLSNLGPDRLKPLELLNKLKNLKLETLYPNVCIAIRLFCTLPVSVAGAERSFSALKRIKNYSRSTMGQERLCGLTTLALETDLARTLNFEDVIDTFASKRARRAIL